MFKAGFSVQKQKYLLTGYWNFPPKKERLTTMNYSFSVLYISFSTNLRLNLRCLESAVKNKVVARKQVTPRNSFPQKVFSRMTLFLGSASTIKSKIQKVAETLNIMQRNLINCHLKGFPIVSQITMFSQVFRRSQKRIAERRSARDFQNSFRCTISSLWKLQLLSQPCIMLQIWSTLQFLTNSRSASENQAYYGCGFAGGSELAALSYSPLGSCGGDVAKQARGRRKGKVQQAILLTPRSSIIVEAILISIRSMGNVDRTQSCECALNRTSCHYYFHTTSKLVLDNPSKCVCASNQALGGSIMGNNAIRVGVTRKDDSTFVGTEFELMAEVAHQKIDVLEGLNQFEVGREKFFLQLKSRQHQKSHIVIRYLLHEFLIKLAVGLDFCPNHWYAQYLQLCVNLFHFLPSTLDLSFFAHENQVESIVGQEADVLFIAFTISNQSPSQMSVFVKQLFRRRYFWAWLQCSAGEVNGGVSDSECANYYCKIYERAIVRGNVEVKEGRRGEARECCPKRRSG